MNPYVPHRRDSCIPTVKHHIICQHQIEIEVFPSIAEVYFQDERYEDPVDVQVRFSASVFNAPTGKVKWQVVSLTGGPGAGTIDAAGLYTAPLKDGHPFITLTDIIVASSIDDPMRMAYSRVTVVGRGPEPACLPKVEIFPKTSHIYYPEGAHNSHIDKSNTQQIFRTRIHNSASSSIKWFTQNNPDVLPAAPEIEVPGWNKDWYLYKLNNSGIQKMVKVIAALSSDLAVRDEALVVHLNYSWPGIVTI